MSYLQTRRAEVASKKTFKPSKSMQAAAKKGLKLEEKHKTGAATSVGKKRARQLANGEEVSYDIVKRINSYCKRHSVDKKGKNFGNDNDPSKGYIAWLFWGGDTAESWSDKIIKQEEGQD